MKRKASLLAVILLGAASAAIAQINLPNPAAPGMSPETAVRIAVTSELMVDRMINRWLQKYYPGWYADPHEIREIGWDRYAIVQVTSPNNPSRRLYFRLARTVNDDMEPDPGMSRAF